MEKIAEEYNIKVESYLLAEGENGVILLQRKRQRNGEELWAIIKDSSCLTKIKKKKAVWSYGRFPSQRTEAFLKKSRFKLDEAMGIWKSYVNVKRKDTERDWLMQRYSYIQYFV